MRVIAGSAKGRRLFAPDGMDTRPTTDRVRESLFSILSSHVVGADVLDLFAGSGALSVEALSRGANSAVLNDFSRQALKCAARNVELAGFTDKCRFIGREWKAALEGLRGSSFSLVFLDPPYKKLEFYCQAAEALDKLGLLTDDCVIVMEHLSRDTLSVPENFMITDERKYGDTMIAFVARRDTSL